MILNESSLFADWGLRIDGSGADLGAVSVPHVLASVREHGVVLLRGFEASIEKFVAFSNKFAPKFVGHGHGKYRHSIVGEDRTVVGALVGNERVMLHREMAYTPFAPDLVF